MKKDILSDNSLTTLITFPFSVERAIMILLRNNFIQSQSLKLQQFYEE